MEFNVDPGTGVFDGGVVTPTSFDASIQAAADSAEEFANVGDIRECYRKKSVRLLKFVTELIF